MLVTKNKDHYLYENKDGEYHLSVEEYNRLGEKESQKLAEAEIYKKIKSEHSNKSINFDQARNLGFCEYGIKDFCEQLELDITKEYSIKELQEKLTIETFSNYPNECFKLFGRSVLDGFGGVKEVLFNLNGRSTVFFFIVHNFVDDDTLHKFSVKAAYYSLHNFEKEFPNDKRPRLAIEAKEGFIKGEISIQELLAAESAARLASLAAASVDSAAWSAWSAASSAAWSAAMSAWSAADSVARSAAAYSAYSAAYSAYSAALSEVYDHFAKVLIELLEEIKC